MICSICFLEFYLHTFRKPWQVKPEVPDPIQPDVQPTQTAWASVNVLRICCRTQVHLLMTCLSIDFSKDLFLVYWSLLYIYTCHHSRVAKPIHCAQNVKTARLCTEFNKSINNIFFWYATYPRWLPLTLRVPRGLNIETCSDFSENSVKLFVLS